jgi:hypothetical protein
MKHYLILAGIGLIAGLIVGLGYTWLISPVKYVNTAPASLRADYKTQYIQLVAGAFAIDGEVTRAQARLAVLGDANINQTVSALAQQLAASESDPAMVRSLTALAQALSTEPTPAPSPTNLELTATPAPSATPLASATPFILPTHAPTSTPLGEFGFVSKELVCDANLQPPLIQVIMLNADGEQIPGVEVVVDWDGGLDHFFTGLKPELGRGYGDFAMTEGVNYAVHLATSPSAAVTDVAVENCPNPGGTPFPGSWLLTFRQP